jgi:hypothetical protein
MRSIPMVISLAVTSLAAVPGCGTTQAQRRQSASYAMVGGVALALAGVVVYATADDECKDIGGICLLEPVDGEKLLGALMVASGVGMTVAGVLGMPPRPGPSSQPCSRTPAPAACATPPPSGRPRTP